MKNHPTLAKLEEYAADLGRSLFTISRVATGDPRFAQRLSKRIASVERDCAVLEEYMASNPPVKRDGSLACPENIGPALIKRKGATQ